MEFKLSKRAIFLLFWDIVATYGAYSLAAVLTGQMRQVFADTSWVFFLGALALVNILFLAMFRLYSNLWEYASYDELVQILSSVTLGTFVGALILWLLGIAQTRIPIRVFIVAWLLLMVLVGGMRFAFRGSRRFKGFSSLLSSSHSDRPRTLIVGAGETGSMTIKRMINGDYSMQGEPIIAVDDDESKQGQRIHGVRVMGGRDDIQSLVGKFNIQQIVLAIPSASAEDRKAIYDICTKTSCRLLTLPDVKDLRMDELKGVRLREVDLSDLLLRDEVVLNTRMVSGYIAGKTVLVTGGGGSIGSELCRQICTVAPKRLIIFDIYENTAYELLNELKRAYDDIDIRIEIGSVRDKARLERLFSRYKPNVVFHAAAHKHVPLMEDCPREAVKNNVFGTLYTAQAAEKHGVSRFIFISTDKAVNPTSVMGASKRMGEMVIQYLSHKTTSTVFAAVRFGNVLGSNGSVIPLFKKQIAAGGPVTVTHPDIERYFMTIPEAARLVVQAGGIAKGGEIFILDMGQPVKIVDLAKNLIRLSGLEVGKDIEIVFTGLRPGEKLYEELLMESETTIPTSYKSIMVCVGEEVTKEEVARKLDLLEDHLDSSDEEIKRVLQQVVPNYVPDMSTR
ncbi:MAG: polysaccharide biosynthesis protein [Coriobacteriales bacterium]|nr:polysaccharide biosynthesis protein [Coriobacteriales bacterium]